MRNIRLGTFGFLVATHQKQVSIIQTFIGLLSHAKTGGAGYSMYNGMKASLSILALVIAAVAVLPAPVSATTGQLIITTDTTLTENHFGNIFIATDGITLDCAGFSVIEPGSGLRLGINLRGRTGVTVKNCEVIGFPHGYEVTGSSGNTLTGNTATGNDSGFFIANNSGGSTFTDNTATDNGFQGFRIDRSNGNTLTGNTATDNDQGGFFLVLSSGTTLKNNTADGNGGDGGFSISGSPGTILTGNTANGNPGQGFVLSGSSGNTLENNTANGNGFHGFRLGFSNGNTLEKNTANDNTSGFGFRLESISSGNTLTGNKANRNNFGFHIISSGNTLTKNKGCNNITSDAFQGASISNDFNKNKFCTTDGIF